MQWQLRATASTRRKLRGAHVIVHLNFRCRGCSTVLRNCPRDNRPKADKVLHVRTYLCELGASCLLPRSGRSLQCGSPWVIRETHVAALRGNTSSLLLDVCGSHESVAVDAQLVAEILGRRSVCLAPAILSSAACDKPTTLAKTNCCRLGRPPSISPLRAWKPLLCKKVNGLAAFRSRPISVERAVISQSNAQ